MFRIYCVYIYIYIYISSVSDKIHHLERYGVIEAIMELGVDPRPDSPGLRHSFPPVAAPPSSRRFPFLPSQKHLHKSNLARLGLFLSLSLSRVCFSAN